MHKKIPETPINTLAARAVRVKYMNMIYRILAFCRLSCCFLKSMVLLLI